MYKKVQRAQQNATLYMERICFLKDYAGRVFNGSVLLTNWRKSRGARSVSNELLDPEFGWEIPEVSEAFLASSKMKVVKFDENSAKKMWYVSSKNGNKKKFCFPKKNERMKMFPTIQQHITERTFVFIVWEAWLVEVIYCLHILRGVTIFKCWSFCDYAFFPAPLRVKKQDANFKILIKLKFIEK